MRLHLKRVYVTNLTSKRHRRHTKHNVNSRGVRMAVCLHLTLNLFYKRLQMLPNCPTRMTARSKHTGTIGTYNTTSTPDNCHHSCQMFTMDVARDKCGTATANNDDLLRQTATLIKKQKNTLNHNKVHAKTDLLKYNNKNISKNYSYTGQYTGSVHKLISSVYTDYSFSICSNATLMSA